MACTLTNIPGFSLANAVSLLEEYRPKLFEALCRVLGKPLALSFLESPALRLCPGPESFSEEAKQRAYAAFPVLDCVYDFAESKLNLNVTAVHHPYFLARLLIEAGLIAYLPEDDTRQAVYALRKVLKQTTNIEDNDFSERTIIRFCFDPEAIQFPKAFLGIGTLLEKLERELLSGHYPKPKRGSQPDDFDRVFQRLMNNLKRFCKGDLTPGKSPRRRQPTHPMALAARTTLADFDLPAVATLFGKASERILRSDFKASFTPIPLPDSPEGPVPWVATADDAMPLDKSRGLRPLSALSLRPMARLQCRLLNDYGENAPNAIRNFRTDLPTEEAEALCVLPYHKASSMRYVRLCGACVSQRLGWAILRIYSEGSRQTFPALSSLWAMQASRLMLDCRYQANISFWAIVLCRANTPRKPSFSCQGFPWARLPFVFERELGTTRLGKTTFVTLLGKSAGESLEVVTRQELFEALCPKQGELLEVHGLFLVGEIMPLDDEKLQTEAALSNPNRLAGRRDLGFLALEDCSSALLARAMLTQPKNARLRRRRLALVEKASSLGSAPAKFLLGQYELRKECSLSATMLIATAANARFLPAMRYLVEARHQSAKITDDIHEALTRFLASEYNDAKAQYAIAQIHFRRANRCLNNTTEQARALAWLLQSVANGNNAAAYELSRAYASGDAKNPVLARSILLLAVQRGYAPAQYWLAAYDKIGEALFTSSEEEKESLFKQRVESGIPAAQLMLGLFYEFDCQGNPRAKLYAHALFSWVEHTLHDNDAKELRQALEKTLDEKQRSELAFLELWKELKLSEPPASLPLDQLTAELAPGPVMMHPSFIRSIDSLEGDTPSERLMRQIAFVAENSEPVRLGLACEEGFEPTPNLRVSGYGATQGITQLDRALLLVSSSRNDSDNPWDVASVYPIFEHASNTTVYLQGSIASFSHACGLLALSPQGPTRGSANTLVAFDPLWPALKGRYRTNERYSAALYGLVETLTVKSNFFEDLPGEVLQAIRQAVPDAENASHDRLVSFGAIDLSNALYRINSIVRSVDTAYAEVFSVTFLKLEVDAFLPNEYAGNTFTLYVAKDRLEGKPPPKPGQRIDALFELNAYMLATDNISGMALN